MRRRIVMANTYVSLLTHIVYSTKHRRPLIRPETETSLFRYMSGIVANLSSRCLAINGTDDHVHMLVSMAKTIAGLGVDSRGQGIVDAVAQDSRRRKEHEFWLAGRICRVFGERIRRAGSRCVHSSPEGTPWRRHVRGRAPIASSPSRDRCRRTVLVGLKPVARAAANAAVGLFRDAPGAAIRRLRRRRRPRLCHFAAPRLSNRSVAEPPCSEAVQRPCSETAHRRCSEAAERRCSGAAVERRRASAACPLCVSGAAERRNDIAGARRRSALRPSTPPVHRGIGTAA